MPRKDEPSLVSWNFGLGNRTESICKVYLDRFFFPKTQKRDFWVGYQSFIFDILLFSLTLKYFIVHEPRGVPLYYVHKTEQ